MSVCVCVTRRYCIKMAKRRITQTTPRDSPGTLVFWLQKTLMDDPPSPWNLRSKWPTPFQTAHFRPISAHSASTASALELIRSRPRAFQRAIDEPCMLPLSPPKSGIKRDFAVFFQQISTSVKKSLLQSFIVCVILRLGILIQYRRVTDRQTRWHLIPAQRTVQVIKN